MNSQREKDKFCNFLRFQICTYVQNCGKSEIRQKQVFATIAYLLLIFFIQQRRENLNKGKFVSAMVCQNVLYSKLTLAR